MGYDRERHNNDAKVRKIYYFIILLKLALECSKVYLIIDLLIHTL